MEPCPLFKARMRRATRSATVISVFHLDHLYALEIPAENTTERETSIEEVSQQVPDPNNTNDNTEPQAAGEAPPVESSFRPLTRNERRNLWLKEYGDQDFDLQVLGLYQAYPHLEIEMML